MGIPAFALTGVAMGSPLALLACWGLVCLWQMLPSTSALLRKGQSLNAERPALLLGLRQGGWCVGSCWLLMIATMATVDRFALPLALGIAVMVGVAAFIMWQKSPRDSAQSIRKVMSEIAGAMPRHLGRSGMLRLHQPLPPLSRHGTLRSSRVPPELGQPCSEWKLFRWGYSSLSARRSMTLTDEPALTSVTDSGMTMRQLARESPPRTCDP